MGSWEDFLKKHGYNADGTKEGSGADSSAASGEKSEWETFLERHGYNAQGEKVSDTDTRTAATPSVPAAQTQHAQPVQPITIRNTAKPAEQSIMHPGTQGVAAQKEASVQNWINRGIDFTQKYTPGGLKSEEELWNDNYFSQSKRFTLTAKKSEVDENAMTQAEATYTQAIAAEQTALNDVGAVAQRYGATRDEDGTLVFQTQEGADAYKSALDKYSAALGASKNALVEYLLAVKTYGDDQTILQNASQNILKEKAKLESDDYKNAQQELYDAESLYWDQYQNAIGWISNYEKQLQNAKTEEEKDQIRKHIADWKAERDRLKPLVDENERLRPSREARARDYQRYYAATKIDRFQNKFDEDKQNGISFRDVQERTTAAKNQFDYYSRIYENLGAENPEYHDIESREARRNFEDAKAAYEEALQYEEWYIYFSAEAKRGSRDWDYKVARGREIYENAKNEKEEFFQNDRETTWIIALSDETTPEGNRAISDALDRVDRRYPVAKSNIEVLNDEERDMYFYLLATNTDDAFVYYEKLMEKRRAQSIEDIAAWAGTNTGTRILATLASRLLLLYVPGSLGVDMGEYALKPSDIRHALDAGVAEGITEKGLFNQGWLAGAIDKDVPIVGGYSLGNVTQLVASMLDSVVSIALTGPSGWGGEIFLASDAGYGAYRHALENGADQETALLDGILEGIAEGLFEHVSLDKLMTQDLSAGFWKTVFTQGGIEMTEEVSTSLANQLSQKLVLGENSDFMVARRQYILDGYSPNEASNMAFKDAAKGVLDDAIGGLLSGGFMTVGHIGISAIQNAYTKSQQEKIKAANNGFLYFDKTQQHIQAALDAQMVYYNDAFFNGDASRMKQEGLSDEEIESAIKTYNEIKAEYEKASATTEDKYRLATPQEQAEATAEERAVTEEQAQPADAAQEQMAEQKQATVPAEQTAAPAELPVDRSIFTPETAAEDAQSVVELHRQMERDGTLQNRAAAEELLKTAEAATVHVQNAEATGRLTAQQAYDSELALRQVIEKTTAAIEQNNTPAQTTAPVNELGGMDNGRTESVNESQERQAVLGADESNRAVSESTAARANRGRSDSYEIARAVRAGEVDRTSAKAEGIEHGSKNETMLILRDSVVNRIEALKSVREEAAQDGMNVKFFYGYCEINRNGKTIRTEGIYNPNTNTYYIKADQITRNAEQIYRHEVFHKMLLDNPGMREYCVELLMEQYSKEELDRLVAQYYELYKDLYGVVTESMTADEREALKNMYLDEMLADAYAGIRRGGINTTKAEQAMAAFRSDRGKENAAAIERTNGPGENKTAGTETGGEQRYSAEDGVQEADEEEYKKPITEYDIRVLRRIGKKSINEFTSEEIRIAKKWAYKFYQEIGVKSPFFRAWFGDWRAYDKTPIKYIQVNTAKIDPSDVSRNGADNVDTGWHIEVSRKGIEETADKRGKWSKEYHSLKTINEMLENAVLFDTVSVADPSSRLGENAAFMHHFFAPITVDGVKSVAKLYVTEEIGNRNKFYLAKIETVPADSTGLFEKTITPNSSTDTVNYTVSDLYEFVKKYNDRFEEDSKNPIRFNPKATNPALLNADGTPRVFYHGTLAKGITEFKKEYIGSRFAADDVGFFFVDNKQTADDYATSEFNSERRGEVIPVYLSMENPLVFNSGYARRNGYGNIFKDYDEIDVWDDHQQEILTAAKRMNADGIIVDDGRNRMAVTFEPTQAKHAEENIGTYDRGDSRLRYSVEDDDSEYLPLAEKYRDGTASEEETAELQRAVEQAASAAGFTEHLYHGTGAFGFTAFDMKSMDDGASIFLTNDSQIASTYSGVTGSREIRAAADIPENISPVIVASELNAFMPDQEKDNGYSYMYMNRETGLQDLIEQNEMRLLELRDYILYKADLPTNHEGYMRHVNELVKEIESGYNPESNNISTPLYILAEHAGLFDEKTKALALDTESKVRLASMFLKSDMQEAIVKTGLGGYDVEIYTVKEARETLAKASKQGNYSLYSNLGKTYTVDAEGKLWNNLRENVDVSQFNTVIAGAHGYRIYNTFSERTFYPANNATGEFETREEAEKWLSEHRDNEKITLSKTRDVSRWARLSGYDSVVFKGIKDNGGKNANVEMNKEADIYALFKPSQAKSADLVTYDDEGNIIPLSERFRTDRTGEEAWKNSDIRYSVEDDAAAYDEDYRRAVQRDAAEDEPTEKGITVRNGKETADPDYAAEGFARIRKNAQEASLQQLRQMIKKTEEDLRVFNHLKRKGRLTDADVEEMKTVKETLRIQQEELKNKNAEERKQRQKRQDEEAKRQQPRIAKKELKATIAEDFHVAAGQRAITNDLIEQAANKILQRGYLDAEDKRSLFNALLKSGVVNIAPEGYYGEIRSYVQQGRIYVPESVREEFGDDWNDFKNRAFGNRIFLTTHTSDRGIDDWNADLAQMFPGGFEEGATDMKEALEQIVRLAEEGSAENITIAEMMERNRDNYGWSVESQMEALEEKFDAALKSFAEKANVEIKARQEKATEVLKERRRMREMIERESARRQEAEQRNRVMKLLQQLNRMRNRTAPEIKAMIDEVLKDIDTVARSISVHGIENLIDLAKVYEAAKEDPNFIPNPYVEARLARLQQTQLDDMEIGDVIELGRTVSALVHSVQEANRLHSEEYKAEIDATARSFVEEMKATKGSKGGKLYQWAVENHLSPVRMIRHLGGWAEGGASAQIAQSLENGQTRQMRYLMEASQIFDKFTADKENRKWLEKASGKDAEWIKVSVPVNYDVNENDQTEIKWQDVEITPMMRVALYMHSLNFDNLRHIEGGGMTIPNRAYYEKGDMQNAYAYGTRVKMTPETVRSIVKDMTEQERTFAGLLREYYDRYSKDHINEVSMILDGFERAGGENYYHIKIDQNFLSKLPDNIQKNISLESIGSIVNERVFSKVPIVLEDASVSLADHIQQISKYYGFAVPIHDFTAIMNFTDHETGNIFSGSVRELMGQQWGAGAQKYLNKLMEDLQSSSGINEMTATFLRNLRGKLAGASLMFNPAVALSQTASYPGAMQTLGARALAEGLRVWERVDTSLIEKYSPLLWYRNQGNSTQELGDYMDGQTMEHKLPWLLGWIQKMDSATVRRLWAASEYYVKNNTDLRPGSEAEIAAGTDEYYQKVAEMFNRAVYDTQPNYSTMQRPQILRSNSDLTKFLTMFKTVPLQYYNMMFEATGRLTNAKRRGNAEEIKNAAGYFARTAVGLISANAIYVAMKALFKVLRFKDKDYRDEEGELTFGSFMEQLGLDFLDTSAGSLIGGAELLDIVERITAAVGGEKQRYNGIDINALSFVASIAQDVMDLGSAIGSLDGKELASALKDIVKDGVMGTLGLPAQNAETYLLALTKWISPETAERYENLFSDRSKSSLSEESGRYLEAAISVYMDNRTEDLPDEVKQELQRLWEAGQKNAIPSAVPSSVTVGGESVALTSDQKAQFRKDWSRIVSENLEAMIGSEYYQSADETTQGKLIDRLYRYASQLAKSNLNIGFAADRWVTAADEENLQEYLTYCTLQSMMDRQADEATNTAAVTAVMDYVIGGLSEDDCAEIARLYMGGAEGLIPTLAPAEFTYKDENGTGHVATLGAEAQKRYAETYRDVIGDQLGALMSSPEYADADDKTRAALIGKVFDFATGCAKTETAPDFTPEKWILNGFEDMNDGIPLADYIIYNTELKQINGKNEDGDTESGLKDRRTLDLIDGNDWTDDQKISVYLDNCSNSAAGKVRAMDAAGFSWKQIKTVLQADKQETAVLQANISDSAKLKVLEAYCNEKQIVKYQVGYQFGVSFKNYAEVMQNADTNGSGSISQDEARTYIMSMALRPQEAAYLFQMVTDAKNGKNNPFSTTFGAEFYYEMHKND